MAGNKIRGASDIRTASSRIPANSSPHKLFLRIASLEMKRQRYDRERASAEARITECRRRCQQINDEVEQMLDEIQRRYPDVPLPRTGTPGVHGTIPPKTQSNAPSSSITHRY